MEIKTKKNSKWPRIQELKKKNWSALKIAHELKISSSAVYDHCKRRGIKF